MHVLNKVYNVKGLSSGTLWLYWIVAFELWRLQLTPCIKLGICFTNKRILLIIPLFWWDYGNLFCLYHGREGSLRKIPWMRRIVTTYPMASRWSYAGVSGRPRKSRYAMGWCIWTSESGRDRRANYILTKLEKQYFLAFHW